MHSGKDLKKSVHLLPEYKSTQHLESGNIG